MSLSFETVHSKYVQYHLDKRKGERRGRLERGHKHAEILFLRNVWLPLQGTFDNLHPEYEVPDWRGRSYFADFAWLPGQVKLLFEIKGYASHVRDMDRYKYCIELNEKCFCLLWATMCSPSPMTTSSSDRIFAYPCSECA